MAETIGKAKLCEALGWTRPKLDRRLKSDEYFPIVSRGDHFVEWQFDLQSVLDYLNGVTCSKKPKQPPKPSGRIPKAKTQPSPPKGASKGTAAVKSIDLAQLRDTVAPPTSEPSHPPKSKPPRRPVDHAGEATAKQRKDEADATLREMKIASLAGDLVPRGDAERVITMIVAGLATDLDGLPEAIVKVLHLPLETSEAIREVLDPLRRRMVDHGREILRPHNAA